MIKPSYKIRPAQAEDAEGIHLAHIQSIREVCGPFYSQREIAAWGGREFNRSRREADIQNDKVWVVAQQEEIFGYAHFDQFRGEVLALYLHPQIIKMGYGSQLLNMMEKEAQRQQISRLFLIATLNAIPFYQKMGFTNVGAETSVTIQGESIRCQKMEKMLSGSGNLLKNIPTEIPDEITDIIVKKETLRIERIVSKGHQSPEDFWYDQSEHEWVMILKGKATLLFKEGNQSHPMQEGDYINIPAHTLHRVESTSPSEETIWLAIFYS